MPPVLAVAAPRSLVWFRRGRELDLHRHLARSVLDDPVELGACSGAVEAQLGVGWQLGRHLLHDEALPGSTCDGMTLQIAYCGQAQQSVQHAAVTQADLGRLHKALADVGQMRWQAPHHHRVDKHVEVSGCRGVRGAARRQTPLRSVEQLPLQVGQYLPETPHGFSANAQPQVGQVTPQKSTNEVLKNGQCARGMLRSPSLDAARCCFSPIDGFAGGVP